MPVVEIERLRFEYGRRAVLRDLNVSIPAGALYALLGPNGSGKTTLLQILMGLRRGYRGHVSVLGTESARLTLRDRQRIGYVAEGQSLPGWMRIEQIERYLAPLYPTWDASLARGLLERFDLDPRRVVDTLSRGEHMKVALLCALAPRPEVLLMDEPFTGMDAVVKDELVRGLLESSGSEGWTVLLCSHDIGELELLADWVGFLANGGMRLSAPMESVRQRFKHVEITTGDNDARIDGVVDPAWLTLERSGRRIEGVLDEADDSRVEHLLTNRFPGAERIDARSATLREVFVALAKSHPAGVTSEVAA